MYSSYSVDNFQFLGFFFCWFVCFVFVLFFIVVFCFCYFPGNGRVFLISLDFFMICGIFLCANRENAD